MAASKRGSGKREEIAPHGDKRYVRRTGDGEFAEQDDESRSLSRDIPRRASTKVTAGHGDEGDRSARTRGGTTRTSAKRGTAKKSTAKKSTAKKSTAKKSTAKKSTAKKSTARKSTARKSTAAKRGSRR